MTEDLPITIAQFRAALKALNFTPSQVDWAIAEAINGVVVNWGYQTVGSRMNRAQQSPAGDQEQLPDLDQIAGLSVDPFFEPPK